MSNTPETSVNNGSTDNANNVSHYMLIVVAVIVGMAGVMLRFLGSWPYIDAVSNILLIVGTILALKAVFAILK